jgi:hypothetical protein
MKWIVLLLSALLVGCAVPMAPPSPLPTPTTVAGTLLPVETLHQGWVCEGLETEYHIFFLTSEEDWKDVLPQLSADQLVTVTDVTKTVQQMDFQAHGLLLALRTCHSSSSYTIAIDRVVQFPDNQLYVYVELRDPTPGSPVNAVVNGYYYLARVPWSEENVDDPTIKVVAYTLFD